MINEPLQGIKLVFLTLGCVLGATLVGMDYTVANASLQYIAGGIGASVVDAQWVVTAFSMGNAIGLILTGYLSERFGAVRVILWSLMLYLFFSILVGMSFNLNMIILTRFLQGFVGGPLIPIGQTLLLMNFPLRLRGLAITIWGLMLMVAPLSAPTIGAYLSQDYDWSWGFYLNVPIAIVSVIIIWSLLRKRDTDPKPRQLDIMGLALLSIGVISLQTVLTKGQQWDWWNSNLIRELTITSIVAFSFLGIVEYGKKEPLVKFSLFKNVNFMLGTLMTVLSYMALFAAFLITPQWLQVDLNYTPLWSARGLLPSIIFPILAAPMLPYLMRKTRKSFIVAASFLAFSISFFYMTQFYTEVSYAKVVFSRILFGFGAIYATPLIALTFVDITKENLAKASGIYFFCRVFSGSIGASIFETIWQRRTIFHHARLVETVNSYNPLTKEMFSKIEELGLTGKKAIAMMNNVTNDQAIMLATNDVLWISAWLCFGLMFMVLIMGQIRVMKMKKLRLAERRV